MMRWSRSGHPPAPPVERWDEEEEGPQPGSVVGEYLQAVLQAVEEAVVPVEPAETVAEPRAASAAENALAVEEEPVEDQLDACAICLDAMAAWQRLAALPCGHRFHSRCIVGWMPASLTCPLCKRTLAAKDLRF